MGAIHTIHDESDYDYDMKRPKLGEAMFDEYDIFENIFAAIYLFRDLFILSTTFTSCYLPILRRRS